MMPEPLLNVITAESLRSGTYRLLARLLAAAPDAGLLERLCKIDRVTPSDEIGAAWTELRQAAEQAQSDRLALEFHKLFIGLGRGELVPYGSWYRSGFLMDKPLGELRRDLAALGYASGAEAREPEDHAAALCEVMALLVLDQKISFQAQQRFFDTHVGSWLDAFFKDLEMARSARFYRAVGRLGSAFIKLERRYLGRPA